MLHSVLSWPSMLRQGTELPDVGRHPIAVRAGLEPANTLCGPLTLLHPYQGGRLSGLSPSLSKVAVLLSDGDHRKHG